MLRSSLRFMILGWAWGLLLVLLAIVCPRLELIFKDFGIPPPRITIYLFNGLHLGWIWIPFVFMFVEIYRFALGREDHDEQSRISRSWSTLLLLMPLALISFVLVALALPFFTITTRLSG